MSENSISDIKEVMIIDDHTKYCVEQYKEYQNEHITYDKMMINIRKRFKRILSEHKQHTVKETPQLKPIYCRFQLWYDISKSDHKVLLQYQNLLQVPKEGEIVNIMGNPYLVKEIGWALPGPDKEDVYSSYAFVEVIKASNFKVTIGGRKY